MLVTGASRGIGAELALLAAQAGYAVGVNYLNSKREANSVVTRIRAEGGEAVALRADVGQLVEVERMFRELDAGLGAPDVLVNNAGVLSVFALDRVDAHNVEAMYRANVFSAYYCAREAMRRMSTTQGGHGGVIVNISSVASRLGGLGTAYAGAKGAIDAFTWALAKESGSQGVRVVSVRPGLIETDIHNAYSSVEKMQETAKSAVPMGRPGSPFEVAQTVLWLASDAASYVHGTTVDVSGGR